MRRRRTRNNDVAADLMTYLVERRGMTQARIAEILEVDKSFVSRVAAGDRDLSTRQLRLLADVLGVPMGAMLLDAVGRDHTAIGKKKEILDLCVELIDLADKAHTDVRQERERRTAARRSA